MKISNLKKLSEKDLIVFDLDGTLIETKSRIDKQMSGLVARLLTVKKVAVIGGGRYEVFRDLFLRRLLCSRGLLKKLSIFPTTSTTFYRYDRGWRKIYSIELTRHEVSKIQRAFKEVFNKTGYVHPKKIYGELIDNRGTQVTFSALGQDIVTVLGNRGVKLKKNWLKKNFDIKMKMARMLARLLPDLEVRAAGFTSIDVTKKGIDKAYGIRQIQKHLKVPIKKMLFIGDAIFPGGNDYAIVRTGVDYIQVSEPGETKKIIELLLDR